MHKYKPRVHIIQHNPRVDLTQIQSLPAEGVHSFSFPETEFTTVTAYQNQQVKTFYCPRTDFIYQVCVHKEGKWCSTAVIVVEQKHRDYAIHIKMGTCLGVSSHF